MTETIPRYRSCCGTVIFVTFPGPQHSPLCLDGPDCYARYVVEAQTTALLPPIQLTLDLEDVRPPDSV